MFGQNPIRHRERRDDGKLQVREIFPTLQGEGPFVGHPSTFIRLTGCNLACLWCDTQWSDSDDPYLTVDEILNKVRSFDPHFQRLIVLTGGEPVRQDLAQLIPLLLDLRQDTIVQIETAGTLWQDILGWHRVQIICSPKTPKINSSIYEFARAFKYIVKSGVSSNEDGLPIASTQVEDRVAVLARPRPGAPVYLSPCDEYDDIKNIANRAEVARLAMHHGYIAGVQLHKVLGVD